MQIRLQNGKKLQLSFRESEFIFTEQLKKFSEEASSIKNHNCIFKEDYKSAIKLCNGYVSLLKYYLTSDARPAGGGCDRRGAHRSRSR